MTDRARLDHLVAAHFDGTLTEAERDELRRALAEDPDARALLAREARAHVDLSVALGRALPSVPASPLRLAPPARPSPIRWIAAAVALVVFGLFLMRPAPKPFRLLPAMEESATAPDGRDVLAATGTKLTVGGATVEFLAPTIFSTSPSRIALKAGHARFTGGPITVATPAGTLKDIGTQFEVRLNAPLQEGDLVKHYLGGSFRAFVTALVLSGVVEFQSAAQGQPPRRITPDMGTVALSFDTSIGRVRDREGAASLKPVMADRWTIAEEKARLEPGDWVQTGARGANALTLALSNKAQLIIGPAALVELKSAAEIRLHRGEIEVACPEKVTIKVAGPGDAATDVSGTKHLRARDGKLATLDAPPKWLVGYKNNVPTEAMGSLLANVDGRNVALEIGYHKVTVDIRDQIARTEIEESFVNTTGRRLEGVFHFPLPQDASISGFGMWIGNELVNADIVEKQRAREIFETILRENRDPGLLEWTGGNMFKARVFPIDAEKRIRIVYTEVLPKTGGTYRYSYALQSEMLRLHPLKKLKIEVKIHSAEALETVACPSHDVRADKTDHSAHVEFEREEYTPDRDFELRVTPKRSTPTVTLSKHKRGEDGYFLMFINPFDGEAADERDAVPSGEALDVVVVADTSGSMAGAARESQLRFLESLLSSLGAKDRFNVLTSDVEARWLWPANKENTDANRKEALAFVEKRHPLGWSDLDKAFGAVLDRVQKNWHVVYAGDGVVTTGDADPIAFAKRLKAAHDAKKAPGVWHAVAPGSTYESVVMKAIADLGSGSWRAIGGGTDAAQAAHKLLKEIAAPGLKNASIAFEGVEVAAVYPSKLPNLPAGTQQIVVGRFNGAAGALGKVTVRGTRGGQPFEYGADIDLTRADNDNSFIPRLWARHHLDHLLAQGSTPEVKQRIIGLSEDYQIITPYTSLLVLESDADRERFGVRQRFLMRDGEEFFAKGRESADFELKRKQMMAAKLWRRQLRDQILKWLAEMGRDGMANLYAAEGEEYRQQQGQALTGATFSTEREADVPRDEAASKKSEDALGEDVKGGDDAESDHNESADEDDGEEEGGEKLKEMEKKLDSVAAKRPAATPAPEPAIGRGYLAGKDMKSRGRAGGRTRQWHNDFLGALFPDLPVPSGAHAVSPWPKEILDAIRDLNRRGRVSGMRVVVTSGDYSTESILGKDWIVVPSPAGGHDFTIEWCSGNERGAIRAAWLLGRTRDRADADAAAWPSPFALYFDDIAEVYAGYKPSMKKLDDGRLELTLTHPSNDKYATVLVIDPARSAVVEARTIAESKLHSTTTYEEWVDVAGAKWPQRIAVRDAAGKDLSSTKIEIFTVADAPAEIAKRLAIRSDALILGKGARTIAEAKQAVKDGKATIEDQWLLLRTHAATQQWEHAQPHLAAVLKWSDGKRGQAALKIAVFRETRRIEELKAVVLEQARALSNPRPADFACASELLNAAQYVEANERMSILDLLKPVFERRGQTLQWDWHVLSCLQQMGRPEEAFAKIRDMAARHARDLGVQTNYASWLAQRGEIDAALKHLASLQEGRPDHEVQQIRNTAANLLLNAYRLKEFVAYVDATPAKARTSYLLNQYLSALIMLDREDDAWKLVDEWLKSDDRLHLEPALQHALGQGWNMYNYRNQIDEQRMARLVDATRRLTTHAELHIYASQVLHNWRFYQHPTGRAFQKELFERLAKGAATLAPADVQRLVTWLRGYYATDEGDGPWQKVFDEIFARWERDGSPELAALSGHWRPEQRVKQVRKMLADAATDDAKRAAAAQLVAVLMQQPWTAEIEAEIVRLLPMTADPSDERAGIMTFHQFATWLPAARVEAAVRDLPNTTPRREVKAAREFALKDARKACVALFRAMEDAKELAALRPWIQAERFYLQGRLKQDLAAVHKEAIEAIGAALKKGEDDVPAQILARRLAATLVYVAVREESVRAATSAFLSDQKSALVDWKEMTFYLLVALDKGDDVEAALKSWYGSNDEFEKLRWGRAYAMVLAERSRIDAAVEVFEHIEKVDQLTHRDYRMLADWYMVQNLADKRRAARIKSWETLPEYSISNALWNERSKYQRTGDQIPSALDEEVPLKVTALLRKSQQPGNHVALIREFYAMTRDFRLLECLPEAVIGQSSQKIYHFLSQLRSVTDLLQEEATLDRLSKHLATVRARATTDVDRRALSLLEFAVERRASDQSQGAGPHTEAALRALKAAERGAWSDGEAEMMAAFLASQGALSPATLADEQLRQIRALHESVAAQPHARIAIAGHLASTLWSYSRHGDACVALAAALDEYRTSQGGILPVSANGHVSTLATYFEGSRKFADAEKVWLAELGHKHAAAQILWLKQMLYAHYLRALQQGAEVSLGRGEALYEAVHAKMLAELDAAPNEGYMQQLVATLSEIWRTMRHSAAAKRDVHEFAFKALPKILAKFDGRQSQGPVSSVAHALDTVLGPRTAVEFLVGQAETEPKWLRLQGQDFWNRQGWQLADYVKRGKPLGEELEKRTLTLVLAELRDDLRSGQRGNSSIYWIGHDRFWSEKAGDFARTAREVLAERRTESRIVYIAHYMHNGLALHAEATDVLMAAYKDRLLGLDARSTLVSYLTQLRRHADALPIARAMLAERPDRLDFHILVMHVSHNAGEGAAAVRAVLREADKRFRERGQLNESVLAQLGSACLGTQLYAECSAYLEEAVAIHVKTAPNRGVGDGTLAHYYQQLAAAYGGQGLTAKAVDAAAGAIVAWGHHQYGRGQNLSMLESVLAQAKDLDKYVEGFVQEVRKSGVENPILRKAIAKVYAGKGEWAKAIDHLRVGIAFQPNDMETRRLLVKALDESGKRDDATAELLAAVAVAAHDVAIHKELGDRYDAAGNAAEAERAWTNAVEIMPNESESHASYAGTLEADSRWAEAEVQWRQVVRVRTHEPAGYVGLARVLIRLDRRADARKVIDHLKSTPWLPAFGDTAAEVRRLEEMMK